MLHKKWHGFPLRWWKVAVFFLDQGLCGEDKLSKTTYVVILLMLQKSGVHSPRFRLVVKTPMISDTFGTSKPLWPRSMLGGYHADWLLQIWYRRWLGWRRSPAETHGVDGVLGSLISVWYWICSPAQKAASEIGRLSQIFLSSLLLFFNIQESIASCH